MHGVVARPRVVIRVEEAGDSGGDGDPHREYRVCTTAHF